jgi:hypothetical protein
MGSPSREDWKAALTSYVEATESNLRTFRRESREQSPVQRLAVSGLGGVSPAAAA